MGSSSKEFAEMAYQIARAGFDTIKDDHSLANQPWSRWRERVEAISDAVRRANEETGGKCIYAPSLNLPSEQIAEAAREAKSLGAGALLILPGISGFDVMRAVAEDDQVGLPIMGHPALLGSFVTSKEQGLSHGVLFGQLMRIAGADIGIFPNFGGRFSFGKDECDEIAKAGRSELGNLKPLWLSPAGGMTLDRIEEMINFYGKDTASLIGGALHRGDLFENSLAMVQKMRSFS
jgi:ribulose-bisphosphate carboxylase large chain